MRLIRNLVFLMGSFGPVFLPIGGFPSSYMLQQRQFDVPELKLEYIDLTSSWSSIRSKSAQKLPRSVFVGDRGASFWSARVL